MHVHILCIATESIYTEVISAFTKYFFDRGHDVSYQCAFKRNFHEELFSKDINIVIKAQRFFNPKQLPKKSFKILFQSEQFEKLRQFDSLPYVESWDLILDVFQDNVTRAKKCNMMPVRFLPIGYSPVYDKAKSTNFREDKNCNLDCYFFGAGTKFRRELWKKEVVPNAPNSRFANQDLERKKYDNIISAKINIFLPGWEPYFLPTMHIMQVLANRKFLLVVSDTAQDFYPYDNGQHFIVTSTKSLGKAIKDFLKSPKLRMEIADQMYKDIKTNHLFEYYLDKAFLGFTYDAR